MAYDFGSQTLGIQNPFKFEGFGKCASGAVIFLFGIYPLLQVASALKQDKVTGFAYAIVGFLFLVFGAKRFAIGLFQLFKYFVGRSVPTSLAYNKAVSEQQSAEQEKGALRYDAEQLHSMLMGRKNNTYIEPQGWLARLVHSLLPKLIFLPNPIRNLNQELAAWLFHLLSGLCAFAVVYFVAATGMAGEVAQVMLPKLLGICLLIYLLWVWRRTANAIEYRHLSQLKVSSGWSFGSLIALSLIIPVVAGVYLDDWVTTSPQDIDKALTESVFFSPLANIILLCIVSLLVLGSIIPLLIVRMNATNPQTEVSEYRDNLQESVHPTEIFINIENSVLANRRYKEIPNRVYREYDPKLNEQAEGKGSFSGELIVETQPSLAENLNAAIPDNLKKLLTLFAQLAYLTSFYFLFQGVFDGAAVINYWQALPTVEWRAEELAQLNQLLNPLIFNLIAWFSLISAAKILDISSHLFWGEMSFSSLLMFIKTEGTFTESKISTGMAIHDSTRSENTLVRSSITPWVITSRVHSTIFATSGASNLEAPRYILAMHSNPEELDQIVAEIKSFLRDRENIASITNEHDLANASTIHQVNQQTRAIPEQNQKAMSEQEAAARLRDNDDQDIDKA